MPANATLTEESPLRICLFGPMRVELSGQPLVTVRSRKSLWLLALLALRNQRSLDRSWLAETLWPDAELGQAGSSLRSVLSELRQALGDHAALLQSPTRATLRLTGAVVDTHQFDSLIAEGTASSLARAVDLYAGPLVEGVTEEWVAQERGAREEACIQAISALAETALASGDCGLAATYYQRAITMDQYRDSLYRGLMLSLSKSGDNNAALKVYRDFVDFLRSDPQAAPDDLTNDLYGRLRAETRKKTEQPTEPSVAPVSAAQPPAVSGYLPQPLTHFVGREPERIEVSRRLRRSRLLTLTGPGGIGKTRLAVALANDVAQEYPDGVWMVGLEHITVNEQVPEKIASVCGIGSEAGRPPFTKLIATLQSKRLLLVLDNCEHLIDAASNIAHIILINCPNVRVLATSRTVLGVAGETVWSVPPLKVPDTALEPLGNGFLLTTLLRYEGVQLFVERAEAHHASFKLTPANAQAVCEICSSLQDVPLAIELASAWVRSLTPQQIASRLKDKLGLLTDGASSAPWRQQTLRATIDWSYSLLCENERQILNRLSTFAGGWTIEAAEEICTGDGLEPNHILPLLTRLVDSSLIWFEVLSHDHKSAGVATSRGRYGVLETVRQYAAEKLLTAGCVQRYKEKHYDWAVKLAEAAAYQIDNGQQKEGLIQIEWEADNLRAAIEWSRDESVDAEKGLRLAGVLWRYWAFSAQLAKGRRYLTELLDRPDAGKPTYARARAAAGAASLALSEGDFAFGAKLADEAALIFDSLGDEMGTGWALLLAARSSGYLGNIERAKEGFQEA